MKRFQNYGLWVSFFALLGLIFQTYGLLPKLGLTNETFNTIVNAVLTFLVAAGIVNNPTTDNKGYSDDV